MPLALDQSAVSPDCSRIVRETKHGVIIAKLSGCALSVLAFCTVLDVADVTMRPFHATVMPVNLS